jgi:hypothetical protein
VTTTIMTRPASYGHKFSCTDGKVYFLQISDKPQGARKAWVRHLKKVSGGSVNLSRTWSPGAFPERPLKECWTEVDFNSTLVYVLAQYPDATELSRSRRTVPCLSG